MCTHVSITINKAGSRLCVWRLSEVFITEADFPMWAENRKCGDLDFSISRFPSK